MHIPKFLTGHLKGTSGFVRTVGAIISKIEIDPSTPLAKKRMFYTGLYHTMLMPVDRTGENPLWSDPEPYCDDFMPFGIRIAVLLR